MLAAALLAAAPSIPAAAEPYVMERAEMRSMTAENGARYRIYIHRPATPPPADGYPVLYLLDGDDSFPVAAPTADRLARFGADEGFDSGLLVAIGYAPEPAIARRALDYTPPSPAHRDGAGRATGGSPEFRQFIARQLKPAIAAEFPVDTTRETLWGHSYGGLFVLDTLLREPSLFETYVATSPAIWFGDKAVLAGLEGFADRLADAGPRTLVLAVGEREQEPPALDPADPEARAKMARIVAARMVDSNRELAARLAAYEQLTLHHRIMAGETHFSTPLPGIGEAVHHAFRRSE